MIVRYRARANNDVTYDTQHNTSMLRFDDKNSIPLHRHSAYTARTSKAGVMSAMNIDRKPLGTAT